MGIDDATSSNSTGFRTVLIAAATGLASALATFGCATGDPAVEPFVPAQIEQLSIGDEYSAELDEHAAINPGDGTAWRAFQIELRADDAVSIAAESDEFPPGLALFDPDGQLIGAGDALPEDQRNLLVRSIETDGPHTLVVSGDTLGASGRFDLTVDTVDEPDEQLSFPGEAVGIAFLDGPTHPAGDLPGRAHPLQFDEQTPVELRATSEDFPPHLSVVDPDTDDVVAETAAEPGEPAVLTTYLPAGSWEIWVGPGQTGPDGYYRLEANRAELDLPGELELGEPYRGVLTWQQSQIPATSYSGQPFDIILDDPAVLDARLNTEHFEGLLVLTDQDSTPLAKANSVLRDIDEVRLSRPLEPGEYTLWVSDVYGEHARGQFELTTQLRDPPKTERIEPDTTIEGSLNEASLIHPQRQSFIEYYTVDFDDPTRLDIELISEEFDAFLVVEDKTTGDVVAENDDAHLGTTDARIEHTFEPGSYRIGVTSFTPNTPGAFTLNVQRGVVPRGF